jgi:hypothetical protein
MRIRNHIIGGLGRSSGDDGLHDGVVLADFLCCLEGDENATLPMFELEIIDQRIWHYANGYGRHRRWNNSDALGLAGRGRDAC